MREDCWEDFGDKDFECLNLNKLLGKLGRQEWRKMDTWLEKFQNEVKTIRTILEIS